jgi:hypothetical protein
MESCSGKTTQALLFKSGLTIKEGWPARARTEVASSFSVTRALKKHLSPFGLGVAVSR